MTNARRQSRFRTTLKWIGWVLLVQFILINISGIFYGYKLTYFYDSSRAAPPSGNLLTKTWSLFTGPRFQKSANEETPHFSFETVQLFTRDSLAINGWYIPVDSPKGTVILVHALASNKSMLLKEAYEFMFLGFNVLMIDLRAHGASGGNVTTLGYAESEDVNLAYDFVQKKGEKNIVFYGVSLGATVMAKAIADYHLSPAKFIMEIPFNSQEKLFAKRGRMLGFPEEPFGVLVTFWASIERGFNAFRQKTSRWAEQVTCPVLIQYGGLDKIVSFDETNSIYTHLASKKKKLVNFENSDHEFLLNRDAPKWRAEVSTFLLQ